MQFFKKNISLSIKDIKQFLLYLLIDFTLLVLYMELSYHFVPCGGLSSGLFRYEYPLLIIFLSLLYFPNRKKVIYIYTLPLIFILTLYISSDVIFSFISRSPRISDIQNFLSVINFVPQLAFLALFSILFLATVLFFIIFQEKQSRIFIASKILLVFMIGFLLTSDSFIKTYIDNFNYKSWSSRLTTKINGRICTFIYYIYSEKQQKQKLLTFKNTTQYTTIQPENTLYPGAPKQKRNVHIIILESFLDPRLIQEITLDNAVLAPNLLKYLPKQNEKKDFSYPISPVYGGGTAQAEFELLAGVPALAQVDSADFCTMRGKNTDSLVSKLSQYGYATLATIASTSTCYNSPQAYTSLGLQDIVFLGEDEEMLKKVYNDDIFFDGDVFDYNLKKITPILQQKKPLFNYILGIYGHVAYQRNKEKRPDAVTVKTSSDMLAIINQFYYRTRALAGYLEKLQKLDPTALIYVTSDHLPPILGQNIHYKFDRYVNIAFLLDAEKPVNVSGKKYYQIPWLIWDTLTETQTKRPDKADELNNLYWKVLTKSVFGK